MADIVEELYASDEASALTNRAAREIERLRERLGDPKYEPPPARRPTLDERIRAKRAEIQQALDRGDTLRAHELDREERALWDQVRG